MPGSDTHTVSLSKHYEVRHWMRTFGCTEAELYAAVRQVGSDIDAVRHHLASTPRRPLAGHIDSSQRIGPTHHSS